MFDIYAQQYTLERDDTDYRLISRDFIHIDRFRGEDIICVEPEALTLLARTAFRDISFLYRTEHVKQLAAILDDPESSDNDKFVAFMLLRNAEIAAEGILPLCQDTGTATIFAKKGHHIWTDGMDAEHLVKGIYETYHDENLRYSQVVALDMYREKNSGNNLPAQIDIFASEGDEYEFLFIAKGGGSANKTMLFQETKALLTPERLEKFLIDKIQSLGTAACPPYHVAIVVGGTSAEANLKILKLATARYLDNIPATGNEYGLAFRDLELEEKLLRTSQKLGLGAQFGGKHFVLDVRVIRLPRHGASCPVSIGVSCVADRNAKAKINRDGIWLEQLERQPGRFIPERYRLKLRDDNEIRIDLHQPMSEILSQLSKLQVGTRVLLNGPIIVARDMAHARLKELLDKGESLPDFIKNHPVYYAGPAKTPPGMPSGSFGPTTAGRMDDYVELFQQHGASMVMIAKGNRSSVVTESCKKYGGFYLGSPGGPAAILAKENILSVELIAYPELGMEAIYRIEVKDFPAFILVDNKGNDFYRMLLKNI